MKTRIPLLLPLVCTVIASLLIIVPATQAGFIATLEQVGPNVVETGSGAVDLSGLSFTSTHHAAAGMVPDIGVIVTGPSVFVAIDEYTGFSGPTTFGSGSETDAKSGSGDSVGIAVTLGIFSVPAGYVSDTALSNSFTYDSTNFTMLGVTPGTFKWTWGTGPNQNFTLKIGTATAPDSGSTFGLLFVSLVTLLVSRRLVNIRSPYSFVLMNKLIRNLLGSVCILSLLFGFGSQANAGSVFGPIKPYTSFSDSPFSGQSFNYFHLETFEEGALTAPGVTASTGLVLGPGALIDSVDGGGNAGHSFFSADGNAGITFTFDAGVLGHLPTEAAIAWTDGGGPNRTFMAFDASNNLIGTIIDPSPSFFDSGDGNPANYRLFGAIDAGGISSIFISNSSGGIEVDHLQYGFRSAVSDAGSTLMLLGVALGGISFLRRRA